MFGGPLEHPKKGKLQIRANRLPDIQMPCQQPYMYGHNARPLKSDYNVRYLHYKQRLRETLQNISKQFSKQTLDDKLFVQYLNHFEKVQLQKEIKKRAEEKIRLHDDELQRRREKLIDLLHKEEKDYFYESVDQAQRGKETKLMEMKLKAEQMRIAKETERMEYVEKMRNLQIRYQNDAIRPVMEKLHNAETKLVNLQQIRENQSKREAEKEIDAFYHSIAMKDLEEKIRREEQNAIRNGLEMKDITECWDHQIKGKKLHEAEMKESKLREFEELMMMKQQMDEQNSRDKENEMKRKRETSKELSNQIAMSKKFLDDRRHQEEIIDKSFRDMIKEELEREVDTGYERKLQNMRECKIYTKYLKDIERQTREQEKLANEIIEKDRLEIENKREAAICDRMKAREKLNQEVLMIRSGQLKEQEKLKDEIKKNYEMESELLRQYQEINTCLENEHIRSKKEEALQYKNDLLRQIAYKNMLKEHEKEELQREYLHSQEEEERYNKLIENLIQKKIEIGVQHPFRAVLQEFECFCKEKMHSENTKK